MAALARTGWELKYTPDKNDFVEYLQKLRELTDRQWSIGLRISKKDEIVDTQEGGPAARAGIGPGMTLIAVNGKKYTDVVLDAAILAAQKSRQPLELLVENADFYKTYRVEYFDGPRYPHLARVDGKPDVLSLVLAPRVK